MPEDFVVNVSQNKFLPLFPPIESSYPVSMRVRPRLTVAPCSPRFQCARVSMRRVTLGRNLTLADDVVGRLYGLRNEGEESCEQRVLLLQEQPQ